MSLFCSLSRGFFALLLLLFVWWVFSIESYCIEKVLFSVKRFINMKTFMQIQFNGRDKFRDSDTLEAVYWTVLLQYEVEIVCTDTCFWTFKNEKHFKAWFFFYLIESSLCMLVVQIGFGFGFFFSSFSWNRFRDVVMSNSIHCRLNFNIRSFFKMAS